MILTWRKTFFVGLALLQAACGNFVSGTWEDDPKNWERAFRSAKPPDVIVVHSKYWRSPHFTYEFQYFFEVAQYTSLKTQLFAENRLRRIEGEQVAKAKENHFGEAPSWFTPKSVGDYEVWMYDDRPGDNFRVFIDKETGTIFLTGWQV